jgi:hypothetical protein
VTILSTRCPVKSDTVFSKQVALPGLRSSLWKAGACSAFYFNRLDLRLLRWFRSFYIRFRREPCVGLLRSWHRQAHKERSARKGTCHRNCGSKFEQLRVLIGDATSRKCLCCVLPYIWRCKAEIRLCTTASRHQVDLRWRSSSSKLVSASAPSGYNTLMECCLRIHSA